MRAVLAGAVLFLCVGGAAAAELMPVDCTLVVEYPSGKVLVEEGECGQRAAPFSSFKFPLAVMGFDAGILKDENLPVWSREKVDATPEIWMKESFLWYSQRLTREMGMELFVRYVDRFGYGNKDVRGDDGLTRSWVGAPLAISPWEQVRFLQRFWDQELGVSVQAYEKAQEVMPEFVAGDWVLRGKTGSSAREVERPIGWFVGWTEKDGRRVLFARHRVGDGPFENYGGLMMREDMLTRWHTLITKH